MKCMRCGAPVEIYFSVLLCDACCDKQINTSKLEKAHKRLGETDLDGFQKAGILSVSELEQMWNA